MYRFASPNATVSGCVNTTVTGWVIAFTACLHGVRAGSARIYAPALRTVCAGRPHLGWLQLQQQILDAPPKIKQRPGNRRADSLEDQKPRARIDISVRLTLQRKSQSHN